MPVDHQYFLRSDRLHLTRTRLERRRTDLELLSGDARQVAEAALDGYLARGFRQVEVSDRGDGLVRYAVHRGGVGRINTAIDNTGAMPFHPRFMGVVALDWEPTGSGVDHPTARPDATGITKPSGN